MNFVIVFLFSCLPIFFFYYFFLSAPLEIILSMSVLKKEEETLTERLNHYSATKKFRNVDCHFLKLINCEMFGRDDKLRRENVQPFV